MRRCVAWTVAWPSCCAARHLPSNPRSPRLRKRAEQHIDMLVVQRRRERMGLGRGRRCEGVGAYRRRRRRRRGCERLSAAARTHNSEQLALPLKTNRGACIPSWKARHRCRASGPAQHGEPQITLMAEGRRAPAAGAASPCPCSLSFARAGGDTRPCGDTTPGGSSIGESRPCGETTVSGSKCTDRVRAISGRPGCCAEGSPQGRGGEAQARQHQALASAPEDSMQFARHRKQNEEEGCVVAHRIGAVSRAARAGLLQD